MKKYIKPIVCTIVVIALAVWIVDKIPFTQKIDQTIEATVYKDGVMIDETPVYMKGKKNRYLFRPNSFVGEFRISYAEKTDVEDLQTKISWHKDDNLQSISHFYKGNFSTSDERGIAYYLLISKDMKEFALMTTEQEVIATSKEACKLYTDHISYDGNGHMTVRGVEEIPELR